MPKHHGTDIARAWRRPSGQRPWVLGHRGARHAAPENTLAAFELAAREGADGFELDVRLDGSGRVIVLHDTNLARVTGNRDRRAAEGVSSAELSLVDVGSGERVPELREVLEFTRSRALRVNVELKHDVRNRRELVSKVQSLIGTLPDAPDWILLSCFHPAIVLRLARALPHVPVAWLVHKQQHVLRRAPAWRLLGAVGVHPEHPLITPARLVALRAGGALVNTWTVNDPERAAALAELGVDAIISDTPGAILARLQRADTAGARG
ncbi:MAG TPA: glycerophosphodiester phosphodiesterase family protein [Polyangiaceae bacterium]